VISTTTPYDGSVLRLVTEQRLAEVHEQGRTLRFRCIDGAFHIVAVRPGAITMSVYTDYQLARFNRVKELVLAEWKRLQGAAKVARV